MRTIAIVNQKGGAGKTTVATNLAIAALEDGKSARVFDLDQQPSAFGWFQAREDKSGALRVVPTHHAALPGLLAEAEAEGVAIVLIDTAPKTEPAARAAIEACDLVLIPCIPSAHNLRAIQDTLELCRARGKKPLVILNGVEANSPLTQEAFDVLEQQHVDVLPITIGDRRAFKHTETDGRGVLEYEPRGKAAEEIRALYRTLAKLKIKRKAAQ